jgi:UDP-glucose 4-epimerase
MKKAVVFGGSGFLGSYVVDELFARGYAVKIADICESVYAPDSVEFVRCDILDADAVRQAVDGYEIVYNFAGLADLNEAIDEPLLTINLNVIGNINILEACKVCGVKRFVYASSAYAVSNKGSFYGISKHTSEKITEEYGKRYDIPYTIIRYGSLYGDRAGASNYIYALLKSAIIDKKIVLKGNGEEVREYIHAIDAARLSVDMLESDSFANEHLILTGMEKLRRKDLFVMIDEMLGHSVEIEHAQMRYEGHYQVTPYAFHPSTAKKLVANPYIDMGQGLVNCIKSIHEESGLSFEE